MRIIIDTNVLVSALLKPASPPAVAVEWIFQNATFLLSPELLTEYEEVLTRDKFTKAISGKQVISLLASMAREAVFLIPFTIVVDCADATDNKLLALAIDGLADCIVTGDDHLLCLHPYQSISILKASDFLKTVL